MTIIRAANIRYIYWQVQKIALCRLSSKNYMYWRHNIFHINHLALEIDI